MMADEPAHAPLDPDVRPRLPRGARLAHNEAQGGWVLLAPERVFKADVIAVEIIKRCDGKATLGEIVDDLAAAYSAPARAHSHRRDGAVARAVRETTLGTVISTVQQPGFA